MVASVGYAVRNLLAQSDDMSSYFSYGATTSNLNGLDFEGYGKAITTLSRELKMKVKFYDIPPDIFKDLYDIDDRDFKQEVHFISNLLGISVGRIRICGDHPVGDDVIFIDGIYNGYLDQSFYDFMLYGIDPYEDYEEWVKYWKPDRR